MNEHLVKALKTLQHVAVCVSWYDMVRWIACSATSYLGKRRIGGVLCGMLLTIAQCLWNAKGRRI